MRVGASTPRAAALLGFFVAMIVSSRAFGQDRSVIIVDARNQPAANESLPSLGRAIAAQKRLRRVSPTELTRAFSAPLPPPPEAPEKSIASHLEAADDAIARFDYDKALIQIFRAERILIDLPPNRERRRTLAEINFRIGRIHLAKKNRSRARESFGAVHFLRPGHELDPARYTPDVVGEFERARPGAEDSTLSLSASVEEAAVFVDGRPHGFAPVEIRVPAGVHYVVVSRPGFRPSGRRVVTEPGGVEPVRVALGPLPAPLIAQSLRRSLRSRTLQAAQDILFVGRSAMRMTGAGTAIVIVNEGEDEDENEKEVAYSITKDSVGPAHVLPADASEVAAELAPQPVSFPPGTEPQPWYRRPWTLAAVGGAALTATVVTLVVLTTRTEMRPAGGLCFPPDC